MAKRKAATRPADTMSPSGVPTAAAIGSSTTYTVLARRYRPQQFADIVGQEPVAQALVNAIQSNRVAHAYLFTGARGVGKTSTARILAKALNCRNGPTSTPCDTCEICRSIASGEDVDILEIDGASNRGIDEIRELRQNVQYRPSRSRYKVYIIDEVHMLTPQAFNALLKTLEEPPPHVKFIFATTEVQKIPVTILSRCQRFDFAGIGTARIVERLRQVVAEEKMEADDEALELIARRAAGSMRDAQSLLDQLLAFGEQRLTTDHVHRMLGTAQDDRVVALASAVLNKDAKQGLALLGQAAADGLQLGELLDQLIEYWRDLMIVKCAGTEGRDLSVPSRHRETIVGQATALPLDTILAGLDVLATTRARLRGSSHARVLMEMALVRLERLQELMSLTQLTQMLTEPGAGRGETRTETRGRTDGGNRGNPSPGVRERPDATGRAPAAAEEERADNRGPGVPALSSSPRPANAAPNPVAAAETIALTDESLTRVWRTVLSQIGPMLAGDLEKADGVAISGPKTLVLRFTPGYNHQREHCQESGRMARVQDVLRKITGEPWNIRVEAVSVAPAASAAQSADSENSPSSYRRQRVEAGQQPLVKRAMERLGAQIVRMDEGFGAASAEPVDRGETIGPEEGTDE